MFDSAVADLSKQKVQTYCATYRHPNLGSFKVSEMYTMSKEAGRSWEGTDVSYRHGCYLIYSESGELLYIGKASLTTSNIGRRLWVHLHKPRPSWVPPAAFVQIVEVGQPFEAASLEEFLIQELHPKFNAHGRTRGEEISDLLAVRA